jgi:uncharacterized protein (TIGR00297 family)
VILHPTAAWGALLALAGAVLIHLTRQGTRSGALAGFAVALLAALGLGAAALLPLAIFVLGSGVLTQVGRGRKERIGAAEPDGGRRGVAHVAAKLTLPAAASALALFGAAPERALALVYTASLAGAFADTAATELGPVIGGPAFGFRAGRIAALPHGTPGGMSAAGFAAAAAATLAVAGSAWSVLLLDSIPAAGIAAGAGFLASGLESLLAGTRWGTSLGHFGRNVFLSLASAGLAVSARACGWAGP